MAHAAKILLVNNHPTPSPLQILHSTKRICDLIVETDPVKAVHHWAEHTPDLIVFDVELPEGRLADLVARLRGESIVPIVLLTSNKTEEFALKVYKAGADECIHKPVSPDLLEARLKVWCRRTGTASLDLLEPLRIGDVQLIPSDRALILRGGSPIRLTPLEMRLMYCLMGKPGRAFTSDELCQRIWRDSPEGDRATLKNTVYRLRQKIETDPARPLYICTVPGVGYQFGS